MFNSTPLATLIIASLAAAWIIQYALSFWQMQRFYKRIAALRKEKKGRSSIGMAGSAWKRRIYAVLVFDRENRILAVEQLSGWTIFAGLKPVKGLDGTRIEDLFEKEDEIAPAFNQKLYAAIQNAAQHVIDAQQRKLAEQTQVEETALAGSEGT